MQSFYGDPTMQNTSGQGNQSTIPPEIQRWNWGAFWLSWIWGIGNRVWISLLMFIPILNLIMVFVLGAKGSTWAWKNKRWESVDHFLITQKKWAKWGWIFFIGFTILSLLLTVSIALLIWWFLPDLINYIESDITILESVWLFEILQFFGLIENSPLDTFPSTDPSMFQNNDPNYY